MVGGSPPSRALLHFSILHSHTLCTALPRCSGVDVAIGPDRTVPPVDFIGVPGEGITARGADQIAHRRLSGAPGARQRTISLSPTLAVGPGRGCPRQSTSQVCMEVRRNFGGWGVQGYPRRLIGRSCRRTFFTTPQGCSNACRTPPPYTGDLSVLPTQSFVLTVGEELLVIEPMIRVGIEFWVNLLELRNGQKKLSDPFL